ncbi:MAG TPA: ATP-binding protein [Candidatus Bipolaricaulis sp.]|nr:ATP-binding protein [Candidatus Bipolaricaulis sp.]HRS13962.1 ATP-binding protein [Candidatus Bipolaricaulis sp.]HRU22210.1 ATP-binding protein [Candidatus Bipolaricaulis sp.]
MSREKMTRRRRVWIVTGLFVGCAALVWGTAIPAGWTMALGGNLSVLLTLVGIALFSASFLLGWLGTALAWVGAGLLALPVLVIPEFMLPQPMMGAVIPLLFAGIAVLGRGVGYLWEQRSHRREIHERLEDCYGREFYENSLNIIHVMSNRGNVSRRNRRSQELLGWPGRQSLQISEYVHPEDIDHFKDLLKTLFERGELRQERLRFLSQGGRAITVDIQGRRVTGTVAVLEAQDRSEVQSLEHKLREQEARYRFLIEDGIDTLDLGIILWDEGKRVLWANQAVEEFFGVDREALVGLPAERVRDRIAEALDNGEEYVARVKDAYRSGTAVDPLVTRIRPGTGRHEKVIQYRSIPIETARYRGGRIDYYTDITELKRLEDALRQEKAHLDEVNRNLKNFSDIVSHDLRNPTRTALGYLTSILDRHSDGELPAEVRADLEKAQGRLQRMDQLIVDLTKFSQMRVDSSRYEEVDVGRLVQEVCEDLGDRLKSVSVTIAPDLPRVWAVPSLLRDVFQNLIWNAIKFNDKALPTVEVGWKPYRGDSYLFYVRDNGPGIEADYLDIIFKIFEKLNSKTEGTGAGLAICRRIVEEHDGRIWAESEVGVGTTFNFTIPRVPANKGVESDAR